MNEKKIKKMNEKRVKKMNEKKVRNSNRKITIINDEMIKFSDGSFITFDHAQDCCEWNYADFKQLDDLARNYEFKGQMFFEEVQGSGFRFGDSRRMFFIPCYSEQNGYYSDEIQIYYNGKEVLYFSAEFVEC